MATGFPAATGDVVSENMWNGLVTYNVGSDQTIKLLSCLMVLWVTLTLVQLQKKLT